MTKKYAKDLNQQQRRAVEFGKGPLLILAGAGSGKTRALTYRTAYLLSQKKVAPENILLVTFTNKAAEEMKGRLKKLIKTSELPFAGTFHAFCARFLRKEGKSLGIPAGFTIFDEKDSIEIIKQAMGNLGLLDQVYKPQAIKAAISQAKNELITPLEYEGFSRSAFYETVAKVYFEYQRLLKSYEALDFDDLLMQAVKLLAKDRQVLEKYRNKYIYVLVDEYQDTNKAQYELTKMLASKWRNLTVVGDASQSVYGWRGADYRNLNNLKQDFKDLTIINLEQNYRSTEKILKAANQVIEKNTGHPVLKLWTENKEGERIRVVELAGEKQEAEYIANLIQSSGKYNEFAILYRTNAQSRAIEEVFIRMGIPYVLVGGVKFYERKEVKDLLAYLKYLKNPKDGVSYKRIEKLGKRKLDKFLEWAENNKDNNLVTREILEEILKVTKYLDKFDKKDEQDLGRIENIKELKSVAEEFKDLEGFLENVALVEQTDPSSLKAWLGVNRQDSKGAVTLMTLHTSKGLEFKNVFMVGMEEGLFPHSRSMMDHEELEEERRLCYVGMTRAKEGLYLSYVRRRLYFGSFQSNEISRFLTDIDKNLIEFIGAAPHWAQDKISHDENLDNFDMINADDY